jgi:hypothetical protein
VIADAIEAGKAKVAPAEMETPAAEEPEPEAPSADEVAEEPAYEQTAPGETVGEEEVTTGVASGQAPADAEGES